MAVNRLGAFLSEVQPRRAAPTDARSAHPEGINPKGERSESIPPLATILF